ncbi:MAG TPA: metallophosphoesterase [Thermoanaerobaculia bacterium]|nr:metallophosphoesterase [Thermoanaerobaculia bacterium]
MSRRLARTLRRLAVVLVLLGIFLALWAFWWEPARLTSRTYRLEIPRWPNQCSGLRVAVAGDLHVGSPHQGLKMLREIVETMGALRPDLVLLAGDFVIQDVIGGKFVPPEVIARELARLRRLAPETPVYAVLGNHDWWLDAKRVRAALESSGIPVLEDQAVELRLGRCSFWLVGLGDFWEGDPDVARATRGVPAGVPALALTHNPDLFAELPDRFSLVVAAHTHGGQVSIPLVGRPIVPSSYGERYAAGHVVEGGRHLFVTTGLGTSILPVRFRVPPEISLLELRPRILR